MDIQTASAADIISTVELVDDIEVLRATATDLGLKFSGNTGVDTLRTKIIDHAKTLEVPSDDKADQLPDLGDDDEEPIEVAKAIPAGPSIEELLKMDPKEIEDPALRRKVIRAKALRLVRVRVTNLDPSEAQLEGALITVTNKYTGKVSKFVPFGEANEAGWHVPEIILNYLRSQKFVMRREVKGGQFGVKKYNTSHVNKYQIDVLPALTKDEVAKLAAHQRAAGSIDKPE